MSPTSPRARSTLRRLLSVLVLALPLLEILGIIGVNRLIGGWATFGLLVLAFVVGAAIVKREGLRSWRVLSEATRTGQMPSRELADAGLVLVGGLLILVPGFLTDLIGLVLIVPVTRPLARAGLGYLVARQVGFIPGSGGRPQPFDAAAGPTWNSPGRPTTDQPGAGTTVQGTVIDD